MISYFKFRETHYCDTARTAGSSGSGRGGSGSAGGSSGGGSSGGGSSGGGSSGGGSSGGGSSGGGSSGGGGRPSRVSVFVSPPPETITVAPPGYEAPEKPTPRGDPSTEGSFKPFGDILGGVFGEPTQVTGVSTDPFRTIDGQLAFLQPEQEVIPQIPIEQEVPIVPEETCPRSCNIIHIPTGIVSYEGMCSCSTIERYQQDPNYRVEFTTLEPEVIPEIIPEVIPEEVTTVEVEPPITPIEPEIITNDVNPPEFPPEPEPTGTVTPTPTVTATPTGLANFGIAGILFAGVLAFPILAGLGKWK